MRTVFHVSSPGALAIASPKVRNLLADESVELDRVSVVIDDRETIETLGEHRDVAAALGSLPDLVGVRVCNNALSGTGVDAEALPEFAETVESGVGELTRLQSRGFAYIRLLG